MQHRIESNTTIKRTHRTEKMKRGGGTVNNKRTIVVRFLYYKDNKSNLTKTEESRCGINIRLLMRTLWKKLPTFEKAAIPRGKHFT